MNISERYTWEAELGDGSVVTEGADLSTAVRFSLIPNHPMLPRHDAAGVKMVRRFARGFKKSRFNDTELLPDYCLWTDGSNEVGTPNSLVGIVEPGQFIRRRNGEDAWYFVLEVQPEKIILASPFQGLTKALPTLKQVMKTEAEYVHCLVTETFRMYVRSTDGTVLITPPDYELYL